MLYTNEDSAPISTFRWLFVKVVPVKVEYEIAVDAARANPNVPIRRIRVGRTNFRKRVARVIFRTKRDTISSFAQRY